MWPSTSLSLSLSFSLYLSLYLSLSLSLFLSLSQRNMRDKKSLAEPSRAWIATVLLSHFLQQHVPAFLSSYLGHFLISSLGEGLRGEARLYALPRPDNECFQRFESKYQPLLQDTGIELAWHSLG